MAIAPHLLRLNAKGWCLNKGYTLNFSKHVSNTLQLFLHFCVITKYNVEIYIFYPRLEKATFWQSITAWFHSLNPKWQVWFVSSTCLQFLCKISCKKSKLSGLCRAFSVASTRRTFEKATWHLQIGHLVPNVHLPILGCK